MRLCIPFLWTVFIFTSCCPEGNEAIPYKAFDKDFTATVEYKAGSYWIYQEQTSGITDCVYVVSSNKSSLTNSALADKTVNSDKLEMELIMNGRRWKSYSTVYKKERSYFFRFHLSKPETGVQQIIYDQGMEIPSETDKNEDSGMGTETGYPPVNIYRAAVEDDIQTLAWAPHIGIVSKKYKNGSEWKLLHYQVRQ